MPEALDEALLRPGRIDRIYKVGYPSKAGRVRTYEGYFAKVRHELTAEDIDKLATITPYATGATHQGPGQRGADHRDPGRPRGHHLAGRDQGQAPQGARPARGRRVHRAGAARGRRPRGLPRGRRLPHRKHLDDRHRDDREGQRLPRHGRVDPAGGPVHPLAQRVPRPTSTSSLASLAGERMFFEGDSTVGRLRRPGVRDPVATLMEGCLGHGLHRRRRSPPPGSSRSAPRAAGVPASRAETSRSSSGPRWPTGSRTTSAGCSRRPAQILGSTGARC